MSVASKICHEFVEIEIFVDQLHVILQSELAHHLLQRFAIRLAFLTAHDRMRLAENEVQRFGMAANDRLHRFDCELEAFAAIDETECRNDHALADAERRFRRSVLWNGTSGTP